jgi:hypothetical protein
MLETTLEQGAFVMMLEKLRGGTISDHLSKNERTRAAKSFVGGVLPARLSAT